MAESATSGTWGGRLTGLAALLCFGSALAALVAALGSGQGWWHFGAGFTVLRYALFAAAGGVVIALAALIVARRSRGRVLTNLLALLVAGGFVAFLGLQVRTAYSVVPLHDITTNLADVPQFSRLTVRADNLDNVPDLGRPELTMLEPEARWKAVHRQAYGDLRTIRVDAPVAEVVARAERLARERGWEVAVADPASGRLEATETTRFFRFKDDVVVRARPAPGGGTDVDMRSISRVGGSDVGVNAKRIRAFLSDLQQAG
jgi:hypothetical protein